MKRFHMLIVLCAVTLFASPFTYTLNAGKQRTRRPIVVSIDDSRPGRAPKVTVQNDPNGYDIYTGIEVAYPDIEYGGIITLYGVDVFGNIDPGDNGWRFVDPSLPPETFRNATDIVWLQHDWSGTGTLQVGFNSRFDGGYYINPEYLSFDEYGGTAINKWYTVYADSTIVVRMNPGTP